METLRHRRPWSIREPKRMGFQVRDLLRNYIEDSASANWATLIEWVNPDYHKA
jgi:hypothetical protein